MERESLRRWIARESPVPVGKAASAAASVAEAVARRHAEGLPAGDAIDPETIEISWDSEGEPAVVLRAVDREGPSGDPDPAEDIPRIGAVLYELLAGAPPPARKTPPPVQRARPEIPEALGDLVLACFRPGAPGCPGSAAEVAIRLAPFEGVHARTRPLAVLPEREPESARPTPVRPTPLQPTQVLPTPARPLEDRTLARDSRETPMAADAPDSSASGSRILLALGIVAVVVAAAALWYAAFGPGRPRSETTVAVAAAVATPAAVAGTPAAPSPLPTPVPTIAAPPAVAATQAPLRTPAQIPVVTVVAVAPPPAAPTPVAAAPPAPSPAESGPPAADAKDAERLREALDAWIDSTNAHDLSGHMRFYMPRVATFYRSRNVSRDFVWSEKARLFAGISEVRATRPDIRFGPDGKTATTTFQKRWVGPDRRGEVVQQLDWVKTPRGWRIVGERES